MSGLIDAVILHMTQHINAEQSARAAVLAVADWCASNDAISMTVAPILRAEVAPPPPPTAEDVIREWMQDGWDWINPEWPGYLAAALRDAGLLREDT